MKKFKQLKMLNSKNQCKQIPGTIIVNIMCSLFIDIQGGLLFLITKIGHTD
jgi:hypothetical protein